MRDIAKNRKARLDRLLADKNNSKATALRQTLDTNADNRIEVREFLFYAHHALLTEEGLRQEAKFYSLAYPILVKETDDGSWVQHTCHLEQATLVPVLCEGADMDS